NGAEFTDFAAVNPAARLWLDEIANVRIHGETHQRPVDLFAQERAHLKAPNANPYDLARVITQRASSQFRVRLDTNRYSVPAQYAGLRLTMKVYPERLCIYHQDTLIARHPRSYDRHQDIEDPEHPKELLAQRKSAREQRLLSQFLSLSNHAQAYYEGLTARRFNAPSASAQDPGARRNLRQGTHCPRPRRCARLQRLLQRVHRALARSTSPHPNRAGECALAHPARRPARARPARTRSVHL
ncbi:MAG TPA: hypothetical protein VG963_05835, partial [Polyangiaceae bacterium]|nr:hypothetical protein [Polyangiaceae bacterium]